MSFKEIKFGLAAAEKEKSNSPYLLIEGFLDEYGYINEILKGDKFLVLGSKGSGKSAIGSRLDLLATKENYFSKQYYLGNFPYKAFSGILPGNDAPETKLPNHWEFLLLIASLSSFIEDSECKSEDETQLSKMIEAFENLGVLPTADLTQIVQTTRSNKFKFILKDVLSKENYSEKMEKPFDIKMLFSTLQQICYTISLESKHFIIIDGLDDILTQRDRQYKSLSSLILAADRMNSKFKENNVNAEIIVLCRTDLFDKLPGPNNNKIKRDSAIILDWYQDTSNLKSTNLIKLINLRAKISLKRDVDIIEEFFPNQIWDKPTEKFLLEYTRHTPRDIIQLLNEIQGFTKGSKVTRDNVLDGIKSYSVNYFVTEIKDELIGYLTAEDVEKTIQLLSLIGNSVFSFEDVKMIIQNDTRFDSFNLNEVLGRLFNCSAVGNYGGNYVTFKYRNPHAFFNVNQQLIVHKGMRKGLNLKD